eukprot:Sro429_g141020.2  (173) ;mRNA; r:17568-18086
MCTDEIQNVERATGLSARAYCGCPNVIVETTLIENNGGCDPCPAGFKLKDAVLALSDSTYIVGTVLSKQFDENANNDVLLDTPSLPIRTCKEWVSDYAPFLVNEAKCLTVQQAVARQCCEINDNPAGPEDLNLGSDPGPEEVKLVVPKSRGSSSRLAALSALFVSITVAYFL